ncbi:oxysterol-binding protein-related protein 2A-like isoform X1 [Gossypium arboreum]|uniref:oxysterol-binding protein-related protein 2A-like isoform X1 n=2 Tax=Gossypium arboreum TaxID=29729 RepID=UPI000819107C|nr:oxysterol-binding protein-related protein 2A-like isoform X1 [Gossypium arboreum]XP_017612059.1 oxysterol-binding protein-related protein 2A-like isoform X1 [Gossypium arboreum]XP_017612060.1 oxysterol-binding protein-related protein 2A-like isoform X1 [Gossypium arboreum]XP_052875180.1 oxysterol-binding protein-related protein 2A-like isoform X1 [Gossypium arboreum]
MNVYIFEEFRLLVEIGRKKMRVKEMHPLCCISLESLGIGDQSPEVTLTRTRSMPAKALSGSETGNAGRLMAGGSEGTVAGILYKWTNYGKGWRSRWFLLRNGMLSYSKTRRPETLNLPSPDDVRLIGDISTNRLSRIDSCSGRRKNQKTVAIVHLKQISSFRESKSDDRRFYIFTATKTLHLRTDSKRDRVAWIQALVSTRSLLPLRPLNDNLSLVPHDLSISTDRLKKRLHEEGINDDLVKDCEQIVLSEFSEIQGQLKVLCEERTNFLDTIRQLEAYNIESETSGFHGDYQLTKHECSNLGRGNSECSTTESSDDIEKQELEEVSYEEGTLFFDTEEYFTEPAVSCGSVRGAMDHADDLQETKKQLDNVEKIHSDNEDCDSRYPQIERRKKLPDPVEEVKGVSLWSMIKDNVGKDLTRVCLPVYFNEPISSLQKCFEDLEYSYLLDRAYKYGKEGNSLQRILNVAAFAVSGYASSEGRHCKPFNPLLGETYEADYPDKGVRFFSEKVSHHPTLIACHCEGKGWKFWGDSNLRTKFWGRSIQLDPVGVLTLEFDDGEIFQWSKVTTSIYNLILGKVYCDHHGLMHIHGNRNYSCKLKFKEQSILDRNPHQVHGFVEDLSGKKVATLIGKWDDSMYYINGDGSGKPKDCSPSSSATLLWKRNKPPPNLTRYNLTSFAITLNELTPGLQENLPPTDSRLRPDQRHLENGEYDRANSEKQRLERRQRMSRKLQENGWKPRWFQRDSENGSFRYVGGYWESREQAKWDGCPNIFGEFNDVVDSSEQG